MADNFDMKQFLVENKLGAYSKLKENSSSDDLVVKWTKRYLNNEKNDPYFYTEKGLADGFEVIGGQKVKEIIGYDEDDDDEVIGYIYSKSKKDIETEYSEDDLDNAFTSALNSMNEGEAAYEYEKGKAAGEKIEKEKLKENISLDVNKLKAFVKALISLGGSKEDKQAYKDIANLLVKNKLADAAETIMYMDTAPNEMIYSAMMRTYPELWDTLFDNASGDYIALAKPKAGLPEDYAGAEEEKMMDFLAEKDKTEEALSVDYIDRMEGLANVKAKLMILASDWNQEGFEKEDVLEYIKHLLDNQFNEAKKEPTEEAMGGKNPEGDKLVLCFLQGVSKKFDYPVSQAARFVKDTIKSLGY